MRLPVAFYFSREYGVIIGEPFKLGKYPFGSERHYSEIIPYIKEQYRILKNEIHKKGLKNLEKALDRFLRNVCSIAILNGSFKTCLAKELGIKVEDIEKTILSTSYVRERITYLRNNFKKIKKDDPIEYAEVFGEFVSLIGFKKSLSFLRKHNLKIGESTLRGLYKVSILPLDVKQMIKERAIPLTIAFELPLESLYEAISAISGLGYYEARKVLKQFR